MLVFCALFSLLHFRVCYSEKCMWPSQVVELCANETRQRLRCWLVFRNRLPLALPCPAMPSVASGANLAIDALVQWNRSQQSALGETWREKGGRDLRLRGCSSANSKSSSCHSEHRRCYRRRRHYASDAKSIDYCWFPCHVHALSLATSFTDTL